MRESILLTAEKPIDDRLVSEWTIWWFVDLGVVLYVVKHITCYKL